MSPGNVQVLKSSFGTFIGNLSETNYFTDFDAALSNSPSSFINTTIPLSFISNALSLANGWGFATDTQAVFSSKLQAYQSSLNMSSVLQLASTGSQALFSSLESGVLGLFQSYEPGGQPLMMNRRDCDIFFSAGIAAALTGFELVTALCGIIVYMNC